MEHGQNTGLILIADDDPQAIFLIQRSFKQAQIPMRLEVVRDGTEVIQYLSGEGVYGNRSQYPLPRILLLDLSMPKKSGLEVLEWMKSTGFSEPMMISVLTSSKEIVHVEKAYALGAHSYLVKPVSSLDLKAAVERMTKPLAVSNP